MIIGNLKKGDKMPEKALKSIPEGMHTVTVNFWFNGSCKEAIEFYQKAFSAELADLPYKTVKIGSIHT